MQDLIIWPMIILALGTLYLYVPMSKVRLKGVRERTVDPRVYRLNQGEPEESLVFTNALRNQYETPVLYYAACLAAYITGNAGWVMIVLAWGYMVAKLGHVYVHVTTNNLRHRRPVFMAAYFILALMWLVLAIQMLIY